MAGLLGRADQIQFSKPVVPIAAPEKKKEQLSKDHSKSLRFNEPTVEQPYVSQPQIIRIRPREPKEDDEESDERDPREATDPSDKYLRQERKASKSPSRQQTAPKQPRSIDMPGSRRPDGSLAEDPQSLSPVTDFTLNERDSGKRLVAPLFADRSSTNRSEGRGLGSLRTREDSEQPNDRFRPFAFFDVRAARAKEKEQPSREVLEQRAAFQQLINPNARLAAKTPGSFEPVTALDPPKSAIPLRTPVLGGSTAVAKPPESVSPFGGPQARVRPPLSGDVGQGPTKPASAAGPSVDPFRQNPLNRQPSTRDFPARKF